MNCSIRYALVLSFLVLAPEAKPGMAPSPPPRTPTGVYAVVELATVVSPDSTSGCPFTSSDSIDLYLNCYYAGLLNNPAVAGLTLQVYWATLNPNPPTDPNAYFWNYVDDAFSSVHLWNAANPSAPAKTIQLIVMPGFNSPKWELAKLTSCDGLFASPPVTPPSTCGKATFTDTTEPALGTMLPMPWNATYKADWKTFLTALNARYGSDPAFVSIAVAGPTAAVGRNAAAPHRHRFRQVGSTIEECEKAG
jgi:hypothetical protein